SSPNEADQKHTTRSGIVRSVSRAKVEGSLSGVVSGTIPRSSCEARKADDIAREAARARGLKSVSLVSIAVPAHFRRLAAPVSPSRLPIALDRRRPIARMPVVAKCGHFSRNTILGQYRPRKFDVR